MAKNLYSPSMLKSFLNCKYTIFNEINEKALKLVRKEKGLSDIKLLEKGNIHEENYFKILKDKYSKVTNIKPLKITKEEKFKKTLECMKDGHEVIRGGYLIHKEWSGEFDFLIKTKNLKSKFGDYSYEVVDTKNSLKIKVDHITQVSMYSYLLEQAQGVLPEKFYVVLRNLEVEEVLLKYVIEFFKYNKEKYEEFLKKDVEKIKPEKCNFCNICDWSEVCQAKWEKEDHLNQVGGNNKSYIKKLKAKNIRTITDLSNLKKTTVIEDIKPRILDRLITQSKLQKEYQKTGKPIFKILEENLEIQKGFNLIPEPSESDLFFDIESVPDHVYPNGLVYLFGVYYLENNKEKFKAFWSHNRKEEKNNLVKLFDFFEDHFKKYPKAKIYHYGSYELTALNNLTSQHEVKDKELAHYLNLTKFVNLLLIIKQSVQVSENSYSIKDIEKFYGFTRKGEVKKADASGDYYVQWLETNEQNLLDEIESYNKQDCHSTYELRNWLIKIRPENAKWFIPFKEEIEDREFEKELAKYRIKLKNFQTQDKELKEIITDILGFYRREWKPQWREYFERKYLTNDELFQDMEAIADLKLIGKLEREKESYIYTFTFDEQDYKLKKGKRVTVLNHKDDPEKSNTAEIVSLDQVKRIIRLKKGINYGTLEDGISIAPDKPRGIKNFEERTYKFINSYLDKENKYSAILSILKRDVPNIKGIKVGEKIIKSDNFLEEIPKVLLSLNNSYLYIQGPPGSGKTYQAGNAIIELIKAGKKVGISANSHKVIHNVIARVERWAEEKKIKFKGIKAGRLTDEESIYNSKYVKTISRAPEFKTALKDGTLLFAGTKFHFASGHYDQSLDYLFIDEAGQLSIADLVTIGSVAKNICLIGDQNQLGQPIQGVHNGVSGMSILDFLLKGQDTIPEDRGVFLNKTFRLHPKINEFISENFYESRLICDDNNKNRKINFKKNSLVDSEGIRYLPMNHKDNSQKSEEECDVVIDLFKELIGRDFTDIDGKTRKLTIEDILVISPYNAQVNYLISRLDVGARVGTIDKFQGQEAVINIISMVTSDSDSIPRNREFIFSRNRLNVGISRAQCASIILFNPVLLDLYPTTYEQIKLLNNFYKILNYN